MGMKNCWLVILEGEEFKCFDHFIAVKCDFVLKTLNLRSDELVIQISSLINYSFQRLGEKYQQMAIFSLAGKVLAVYKNYLMIDLKLFHYSISPNLLLLFWNTWNVMKVILLDF